MNISIKKFTEHLENIDDLNTVRFYCEQHVNDEIDHLFGMIEFNHTGCFPSYVVETNEWSSWEDADESWGNYEIEYNYRPDGRFDFGILGEGEDFSSFYLYNPIELKQFLNLINEIPKSHTLNLPPRFKEFRLDEVIKNLYVTVLTDEKVKLMELNILKERLSLEDYKGLLDLVFNDNWDFLVEEVGGHWGEYCKSCQLPTTDDYYGKISLLYDNAFVNITNPSIMFDKPHLAFELSPQFSTQYFFDLMYYSSDGPNFIKELYKSLVDNRSLNSIHIPAPKDMVSQIVYSSAFRLQYNNYLNTIKDPSNLRVEQIIDLKSLCINRRDNFKEYILNKDKADLLNSLKHPLPYILDKTFRSYSRATNDFDRQTYSGKLFNYILRSIVIYPLQELVHLNHHLNNDDINNILNELKSGKPISDGTWVTWFNEICKAVGKDNSIKLNYFGNLIGIFQKLYSDILNTIPKRNDWAHYREHSAEYQKHLDKLIPVLMSNIRTALEKIEFIFIEKQEYKTENNLSITAKRVMGYETDIETIEFSTHLPGSSFISKKLYAYKSNSEYTIPLGPFFDIQFDTIETIKMGIFDNIKDGRIEYAY
jgi:hypothetical protein